MKRDEYLTQSIVHAARGEKLPHSKLTDEQVESILSAGRQREHLRTYINANLTNKALAKAYNVSERCIEKIFSRESWSHVA